jgi:hypothetical protein
MREYKKRLGNAAEPGKAAHSAEKLVGKKRPASAPKAAGKKKGG